MGALIRSARLGEERRLLRRADDRLKVAQPQASEERQRCACCAEELEQLRHELSTKLAECDRVLQAERDSLRRAAAAEAEQTLREASEQGYARGIENGEAEGRARWDEQAARLLSLLEQLPVARAQTLEQAEDAIVEIVFEAVCRILGSEAAGHAAVYHAVTESASRVHAGEPLTVALHPDDLLAIQTAGRMPENVKLVSSPALALGGCMIDSSTGTLDARLETQIELLRASLLRVRAARPRRGGA